MSVFGAKCSISVKKESSEPYTLRPTHPGQMAHLREAYTTYICTHY